MTEYTFVMPESKKDFDEYYKIRFEVLRKPWGQPEKSVKDEWEDQSYHVMLKDRDKVIAAGRLQFNSDREGQVRSMAVLEEYRGKGIGTIILKHLEDIAMKKKLSSIILDARDHAVDFYKKNGYQVEGDSYTLFDVIPHFRMSKSLQ